MTKITNNPHRRGCFGYCDFGIVDCPSTSLRMILPRFLLGMVSQKRTRRMVSKVEPFVVW